MPQGRVSHYRILEYLGGTMGKVYLAEDELLRRKVALKFLPAILSNEEDDSSRRFMTEARTASALDHRNICTIHEIGRTEEGEWFIAMSYYEGQTLKHLMSNGGLGSERALDLARQTALGLAAAHQKGIVHRDIKPANIMVTERGRVKILDFGLARLVGHSRQTRTGTVLGTAAYMSPEQANGAVAGPESDIWSLGVVFYEMLAGSLPFAGETEVAQIYSIIHKDPAPLPAEGCQDAKVCARILEKCLDKKPDRRYPSARVLADDLETAKDQETGTRSSHSTRKTISIKPHRLRHTVIGVALAAVLAVAVFGFPAQRDALFRWMGFGGGPASVAVMPFELTGEEGGAEAFGTGLGLMVGDRLKDTGNQGAQLWVVPRADLVRAKVDDRELAANRMSVDYVVAGSGSIQGRVIELEVRVHDISTGTNSTRTFQDSYGNLETWQSEIPKWIAGKIDPQLPEGLPPSTGAVCTPVPEAFLAFGKGLGRLDLMNRNPAFRDSLAPLVTRDFGKAIAADSSFAFAWAGLGQCRFLVPEADGNADLDTALSHFEHAVRLAPGLPQAHLAIAGIHRARNDTAATYAALSRVLVLRRDDSEALLALASAQSAFGDQDAAARTYKRVTKARPRYPYVFLLAGLHHYYQMEFETATVYMEEAVKLAPKDIWGHNNLGAILFYQDRWEEAEDRFRISLEVAASPNAHNNLGTLDYYMGRYPDAIDHYRQAVILQYWAGERPDLDYSTHQNMAEAFRWSPGYEDSARIYFGRALEYLEKELSYNQDDPGMLVDKASFAINLGRPEIARPILDQLTSRTDLMADTMFALASALEETGRREEALIWLDRSLESGVSHRVVNVYPVLRNLRATDEYRILDQKYSDRP